MAESMNIADAGLAEDSGIVIGTDSIGLRSRIVRTVVAEDAAPAKGPERVIGQEQRQGVGGNVQSREHAHRDGVEEVDVNFTDASAGTGDGCAGSAHRDCLERLDLYRC